MSHHLKAFQPDIFGLFRNTCFSFCNVDLLPDSVHAFQIWKEQASFISSGYNDSISLYIQFLFRGNFLRFTENVYTVYKPLQFFRLYR